MAERVGFEPTVHCCITGFQDRLLKPLGHLSRYALIITSPPPKCQETSRSLTSAQDMLNKHPRPQKEKDAAAKDMGLSGEAQAKPSAQPEAPQT